jgi:hypothetical protein
LNFHPSQRHTASSRASACEASQGIDPSS